MAKPIEIHVRLDARTFRRYCVFDAFRRRRAWFLPAMIGMVLITASIALLLFGHGQESLAGVLMGLGIAVPLMFFGLFFIQVEAQVARQKLKDAPPVYSLTLRPEGLAIRNDQKSESEIDLPWGRLHAAYRAADAIYLYATPERAFILPEGQASVASAQLWSALTRYLGPDKCLTVNHNHRNSR